MTTSHIDQEIKVYQITGGTSHIDQEINVYQITGNELTGYNLTNLGRITHIYEKKSVRGFQWVNCIETDLGLFKVNRSGSSIVPVSNSTQLGGEIVLSYDSTFINDQEVCGDDYIQLTDVYKLNIQDIMAETEV